METLSTDMKGSSLRDMMMCKFPAVSRSTDRVHCGSEIVPQMHDEEELNVLVFLEPQSSGVLIRRQREDNDFNTDTDVVVSSGRIRGRRTNESNMFDLRFLYLFIFLSHRLFDLLLRELKRRQWRTMKTKTRMNTFLKCKCE